MIYYGLEWEGVYTNLRWNLIVTKSREVWRHGSDGKTLT